MSESFDFQSAVSSYSVGRFPYTETLLLQLFEEAKRISGVSKDANAVEFSSSIFYDAIRNIRGVNSVESSSQRKAYVRAYQGKKLYFGKVYFEVALIAKGKYVVRLAVKTEKITDKKVIKKNSDTTNEIEIV